MSITLKPFHPTTESDRLLQVVLPVSELGELCFRVSTGRCRPLLPVRAPEKRTFTNFAERREWLFRV